MIRSLGTLRSRGLCTSATRLNAPLSSCPAGTVLNLKVKKSGEEPVALEDKEYPDWLWDVLNKEKNEEQLKAQDVMAWRKKQLNKRNTAKIKNNNFLSQM